jgi:hypothetical protein
VPLLLGTGVALMGLDCNLYSIAKDEYREAIREKLLNNSMHSLHFLSSEKFKEIGYWRKWYELDSWMRRYAETDPFDDDLYCINGPLLKALLADINEGEIISTDDTLHGETYKVAPFLKAMGELDDDKMVFYYGS